MIDEKTVRQVRELAIDEVVKPYVQLRRQGSKLFGCCPFHSERTPSFSVTPERNLFYCFSCQRGGDAIAFYMEKEGVDFNRAVEELAKAHNIAVEYVNSETSEEQRLEAMHHEALQLTAEAVQDYFAGRLRVEVADDAKAAREYAYGRWPQEFCAQFGLGAAPRSSAEFVNFYRAKGLSEQILFELGLLKRNEGDGSAYAMFRNRLTIPIRDRVGRVIGFTARTLDPGAKKRKYVNSINSDLFRKGETVFGIDWAARCRGARFVNIVEGAPDVMRLQIIGLNNTVATLGTAWADLTLTPIGDALFICIDYQQINKTLGIHMG